LPELAKRLSSCRRLGQAVGWEYDAMAEIQTYQNISWDAMIAAVSEGQFDIGMTGITIRDDRKDKVDFSDAYMRSEMVMMVRGDETRFTDAKSFAANADLLMAAQPGTTPFYVGVYEVLDGNEANPRIKLFETFGAGVAGAAGGRRRSGADRWHRRQRLCRGLERRAEDRGRQAGDRGFRLHLPQGVGSGGPDQCRDCRDEGRWHDRRAEHALVPRLQDGRMIQTCPG
jgi:hypothetical protein